MPPLPSENVCVQFAFVAEFMEPWLAIDALQLVFLRLHCSLEHRTIELLSMSILTTIAAKLNRGKKLAAWCHWLVRVILLYTLSCSNSLASASNQTDGLIIFQDCPI